MDRDALFEFIHQITSMNMNKCILEVSAVSNVRSGVCVCVCGAGGGYWLEKCYIIVVIL